MPHHMKRPKPQKFRRWRYTPKRPDKIQFFKAAEQRSQNRQLDSIAVNVASWNTEGIGNPKEVDKIILDNQKFQPDFVCLQNTQLPSDEDGTEHFKWYCSKGQGSAVLVSKKSKWEVKSYDQICDQIIVVKATNDKNIQFALISCYIPPATDYHCQDLWDKLVNILKEIPSNIMYLIGGDFNAQIGHNQDKELPPGCCGHLRYHEENNENGIKLLEIAREAHLNISSTSGLLDMPREKCYTYQDGKTKTQQDLFIRSSSRASGHVSPIQLNWVQKYKHAISSAKVFFRTIKTDNKMVVSTWNIQGVTPSKVDTIMQEQELEVVCLQEIFLTSEDDIQSEHFVWYSSKQQWAKNVGIVVKKSPDIVVNDFTVISENICFADIVYHGNLVKMISCHLPLQTDPKHENVASQISDLIKSIPPSSSYIVTGDLNVKYNLKEEEKDQDNISFVEKLAEEMKINLVTKVWGSSCSQFLTSSNDELKVFSKPLGKKIAFFENSIFSLKISFSEKSAPGHPPSLDFEGNLVTRNIKMEKVDGVNHKITIIEYFDPSGIVEGDEEGTVNPSEDDIKKYSSKSPSVTELGRILENFVLFNGVSEQSINFKSKLQLLVMSFLRGNFGRLITEHVEINNNRKGISRIIWKGILLSETISSGTDQKTMRRQNANFLFSKLGQLFYQIKAKTSFFCKGQPPMFIDDPNCKEIFHKVEKVKYPTMPEALKYIEDFFVNDTDIELVFGKDFNKEELEEIKEFAKSHKFGYRFFASKASDLESDHISVFIRRSPQYLRDKLIQSKEDSKYMLIPPSGVGENYDRHAIKYEVEHFKEEEKLVQKFWKNMRAATRSAKEEEAKQPAGSSESPKPVKDANVKDEAASRQPTKPAKKPNETASRQQSKTSKRPRSNKRQYPVYSSYDNSERFRVDNRKPQNGRHETEGSPPMKRQRQSDPVSDKLPPKITWNTWQSFKPLLIVWPITICSRLEDRSKFVLEDNFPIEYFQDHSGSVAVVVRLPLRNGMERRYTVAFADTKNRAADYALQKLLKHSTIIKPNPAYLCDGAAPNFIRYKVPCQTYPRTYIILSQYDTGPLSLNGIRDIFDTFLSSFNEDLFFDKDGYTFNEKMMIIEEAPKFKLNVRHFGDVPGVINRYICVYKTKPKEQILEEVLKMRDAHPKYSITTDRLPPYLGLNVF